MRVGLGSLVPYICFSASTISINSFSIVSYPVIYVASNCVVCFGHRITLILLLFPFPVCYVMLPLVLVIFIFFCIWYALPKPGVFKNQPLYLAMVSPPSGRPWVCCGGTSSQFWVTLFRLIWYISFSEFTIFCLSTKVEYTPYHVLKYICLWSFSFGWLGSLIGMRAICQAKLSFLF